MKSRVSETFFWNPTSKICSISGIWSDDESQNNRNDAISKSRNAIFSLPYKKYGVYFVAKIFKILEGDTKYSIENYTKPFKKDSAISDSLKKNRIRLHHFKQVLAWTASPCYDKKFRGSEIAKDFEDLYRIPKPYEPFTDEALAESISLLENSKSFKKNKIQGGAVKVSITVLQNSRSDSISNFKTERVVTSSLSLVCDPSINSKYVFDHQRKLNYVKISDTDPIISGKDIIVREVANFYGNNFGSCIESKTKMSSDYEYSNNIFIYPKSVHFDPKYRNVCIKIQVMNK